MPSYKKGQPNSHIKYHPTPLHIDLLG